MKPSMFWIPNGAKSAGSELSVNVPANVTW